MNRERAQTLRTFSTHVEGRTVQTTALDTLAMAVDCRRHDCVTTYYPQGILDVYRYSLSHVQLYGPTNFSSFLDRAIEVSVGTTTQEKQSYFILLVITVSILLNPILLIYIPELM